MSILKAVSLIKHGKYLKKVAAKRIVNGFDKRAMLKMAREGDKAIRRGRAMKRKRK